MAWEIFNLDFILALVMIQVSVFTISHLHFQPHKSSCHHCRQYFTVEFMVLHCCWELCSWRKSRLKTTTTVPFLVQQVWAPIASDGWLWYIPCFSSRPKCKPQLNTFPCSLLAAVSPVHTKQGEAIWAWIKTPKFDSVPIEYCCIWDLENSRQPVWTNTTSQPPPKNQIKAL